MTLAVFDASALLAILLNESGGDLAEKFLVGSAISAVNLSEIVAVYSRKNAALDGIELIVKKSTIQVMPFTVEDSYSVGKMILLTRQAGLSFGDRACLALAQRLGVPAITADRAWKPLGPALGVTVELIR